MKFHKLLDFLRGGLENHDVTDIGGYAGNLVSYDDAVTSGVFGQLINIDLGDRVFDNKRIFAPTYYILNKFSKENANTSIVQGWERQVQKDILLLGATFTSSSSAGEELTITLKSSGYAYDKDHVIERQICVFDFTPTGTGYTNEVYVSSKNTSNMTQIKIKPTDPTKKIGIASGESVGADTVMNMLGTFFPQATGSVDPISFYPTKIENCYQYFKTPYEFDEIAAKERLYIKGNLRTMLDSDARQMHLALIEKSFLFQGEMYRHDTLVTRASAAEREQVGKMRGLFYWIKNGGSPAVMTYPTWSLEKFDEWQFKLFDPELEDPNGKRLVLTNKAGRKAFTDAKFAQMKLDITPIDTYGIPGVTKVQTDYGTMDLMVHPKLNALYPAMDEPIFYALTPTMVVIKNLVNTYLANGIQDNDNTAFKAEYRTALTYLAMNMGTSYFGYFGKA